MMKSNYSSKSSATLRPNIEQSDMLIRANKGLNSGIKDRPRIKKETLSFIEDRKQIMTDRPSNARKKPKNYFKLKKR